jgi:hypothetical protein
MAVEARSDTVAGDVEADRRRGGDGDRVELQPGGEHFLVIAKAGNAGMAAAMPAGRRGELQARIERDRGQMLVARDLAETDDRDPDRAHVSEVPRHRSGLGRHVRRALAGLVDARAQPEPVRAASRYGFILSGRMPPTTSSGTCLGSTARWPLTSAGLPISPGIASAHERRPAALRSFDGVK